jgi:hypothetical protein
VPFAGVTEIRESDMGVLPLLVSVITFNARSNRVTLPKETAIGATVNEAGAGDTVIEQLADAVPAAVPVESVT